MDENEVIVGLTAVVVLGVGAQWVGRRLNIPSLLLLLPAGLVAGETGLVDPTELFGDSLFGLVSMLVALLLFQAGLNLRLDDLPRDARGPVARLVTIGVAVTFGGSAVAVMVATDVPTQVALVLGAILTVSGPTVVGPLLKVVRPRGSTRAVLAWEGTVLDPLGATLAVVVLNVVVASVGDQRIHPLWQVLARVGLGMGVGIVGAGVLVFVMSRFLVTDDMEAAVAVLVAVLCFGVANVILSESGLIATVTLGLVVANQRLVPTARVTGFGETLEVLIIGVLFVLLGALVEFDQIVDNLGSILLIVVLLVLVIRPLSVGISQFRSALPVPDRALAASIDPRGIVAAATAAQFAPTLDGVGIDSTLMSPIVFGVILGTGIVYGVCAPLMSRVLRLRAPEPRAVALVGERPWLEDFGLRLQELGVQVLVVTSRPMAEVSAAPSLEVISIFESERTLIEQLDETPLASAIVASDHGTVVTLVVAELVERLGRRNVHVIPRHDEGTVERLLSATWTPQAFADGLSVEELDRRVAAGAEVRVCADDIPDGAILMATVGDDLDVDLRPTGRRRGPTGTLIALCPREQ